MFLLYCILFQYIFVLIWICIKLPKIICGRIDAPVMTYLTFLWTPIAFNQQCIFFVCEKVRHSLRPHIGEVTQTEILDGSIGAGIFWFVESLWVSCTLADDVVWKFFFPKTWQFCCLMKGRDLLQCLSWSLIYIYISNGNVIAHVAASFPQITFVGGSTVCRPSICQRWNHRKPWKHTGYLRLKQNACLFSQVYPPEN